MHSVYPNQVLHTLPSGELKAELKAMVKVCSGVICFCALRENQHMVSFNKHTFTLQPCTSHHVFWSNIHHLSYTNDSTHVNNTCTYKHTLGASLKLDNTSALSTEHPAANVTNYNHMYR